MVFFSRSVRAIRCGITPPGPRPGPYSPGSKRRAIPATSYSMCQLEVTRNVTAAAAMLIRDDSVFTLRALRGHVDQSHAHVRDDRASENVREYSQTRREADQRTTQLRSGQVSPTSSAPSKLNSTVRTRSKYRLSRILLSRNADDRLPRDRRCHKPTVWPPSMTIA